MVKQKYNITVSLDVYTDCELEEISKCLALQPSATSMKGDTEPAERNFWTLTEKHADCSKSDGFIAEFLRKHEINKEKCDAVKAKGVCVIGFFIDSDYAQIRFVLSRKDVKALSECGLTASISVFSRGGVIKCRR